MENAIGEWSAAATTTTTTNMAQANHSEYRVGKKIPKPVKQRWNARSVLCCDHQVQEYVSHIIYTLIRSLARSLSSSIWPMHNDFVVRASMCARCTVVVLLFGLGSLWLWFGLVLLLYYFCCLWLTNYDCCTIYSSCYRLCGFILPLLLSKFAFMLVDECVCVCIPLILSPFLLIWFINTVNCDYN